MAHPLTGLVHTDIRERTRAAEPLFPWIQVKPEPPLVVTSVVLDYAIIVGGPSVQMLRLLDERSYLSFRETLNQVDIS